VKLSRLWLWLGLACVLALGLARLRFNVEVLDLLPEDLPAVKGLKRYNQNFANARELLITVQAPEADAAEQAARTIAEALWREPDLVASVTWQPPWLEQPGDAAEVFAYVWFNQPPEVFGALTNRLLGEGLAATFTAARERLATSLSPEEVGRLSYDPLELTRLPAGLGEGPEAFAGERDFFASPDGTFRVIFVQARSDLANYRECLRWLEGIKAAVEASRRTHAVPENVALAYTGRPAFVAEISSGMERDITHSVAGTAVIITLLFWWAHRRFRPLLWLLALLVVVLVSTLAFGGLLFGTLSVMSVGFAAILLGLAVDYGLVLYQEALHAPGASAEQVRRTVAPSIGYAALTTGGAFAILNFSGLPGLAQLGSLVAIGVALAAAVMLHFYLPPLLRAEGKRERAEALGRVEPSAPASVGNAVDGQSPTANRQSPVAKEESTLAGRGGILPSALTVALVLGGALMLGSGLPRLDHTANSLRPRDSAAFGTLQQVKQRIGPAQEPLWLLVGGGTESEVAQRLAAVEPLLKHAQAIGTLSSFTLPTTLWPSERHHAANRAAAQALSGGADHLRRTAEQQGFTAESLSFTEALLAAWQRAAERTNTFWPTNELSRWVLDKLVARTPDRCHALGLLYPATNAPAASSLPRLSTLDSRLAENGVWLTGWELLGEALLSVVKQDLWRVVAPMAALICLSLAVAFRRWTEVALSLATLVLSALCLFAIMTLAGWSWNLMNLMALPLLLGMGVDYSIHMQSALRRHGGDVRTARRVTGRALLLCGGTTIAGFGSLSWSSNAGMASLGQVCATGIACAMVVSIGLLPYWWRALAGRTVHGLGEPPEAPAR
jgi:predicted exporter